jgi:hypothetical protein
MQLALLFLKRLFSTGRRRLAAGAVVAAIIAGTTVGLLTAFDGSSNASDSKDSVSAKATATRAKATRTPTVVPALSEPRVETPVAPVSEGGEAPIGPPPAPRVGSLPENVNVSPEFMALHDALNAAVSSYRTATGTNAAVAVTDLQTGETISVQGNRTLRTGCTIHMFALLAITGEFQAGRSNPSTVAGSVQVGIGSSYPPEVRAFLETVFGDYRLGVQRGREMMASWGMSASLFDHVAYYGTSNQNNLLTALETNLALTKLYRGQMFDAQWTAYALGRLRAIKPGLNYMIPGQLPPVATVAHKIGYYLDSDGWVNADAGIVTFPGADGQEKAYAITYLSEQAPSEYAGYSFGAHLSGVVWRWFDERYRQSVPPPPPPTELPPPTARPTRTPRPPATPTRTRTPTPLPVETPTLEPTPEE